jgi:hypothetical protein
MSIMKKPFGNKQHGDHFATVASDYLEANGPHSAELLIYDYTISCFQFMRWSLGLSRLR